MGNSCASHLFINGIHMAILRYDTWGIQDTESKCETPVLEEQGKVGNSATLLQEGCSGNEGGMEKRLFLSSREGCEVKCGLCRNGVSVQKNTADTKRLYCPNLIYRVYCKRAKNYGKEVQGISVVLAE